MHYSIKMAESFDNYEYLDLMQRTLTHNGKRESPYTEQIEQAIHRLLQRMPRAERLNIEVGASVFRVVGNRNN